MLPFIYSLTLLIFWFARTACVWMYGDFGGCVCVAKCNSRLAIAISFAYMFLLVSVVASRKMFNQSSARKEPLKLNTKKGSCDMQDTD